MKRMSILFVCIPLFFAVEVLAQQWALLPGSANDIGAGADGSVWIVGTNETFGGYGIWNWNGNGWSGIDGGAVRIDVDPAGNPWVVNSSDHIYRRASGAWVKMPGSAKDIGIGADGSVWVVGTNPTEGGYGLWKWDGNAWQTIDGGGVRIDVDSNGNPWTVNSSGHIYRRSGGTWTRMPGSARDIGIGKDGSVWVVGTNPSHGGHGLWTWNGNSWQSIDGGAEEITVGNNGLPLVVNVFKQIYQRR